MTSSATAHHDRLARAKAAMGTDGIELLLITPGADMRWLVGYDALPLERLTCLAVPADGDPFLVVPRLELDAAAASGATGLVDTMTHGETDDAFAMTLDRLGKPPQRIAVSDRMWAQNVLRWRHQLPTSQLTLAGDVLRPLRLVKAGDEIESLRAAGAAIDSVHARMAEWLRPGRTEREVARDIAAAIVEAGHVAVNFVIVGSGPNGASPHHSVSDRTIETGDPVVVDIGGTMADGYCSDCTRVYAAGGPPPAEFAAYYDVLHEAQRVSCASVKPGVTAAAVDAAARDIITAAGFGEEFLHRTGHGIGLEEHEEPWIVTGNDTVLESGMCFSIEPGIYVSGRHGARIEDIVVCTDTGVEELDTISRELVVLF